jgi:hypothetical protein
MKPSLLILVESDPRNSPRPAEAVRIAAGVCAWNKADVTLCLRGPAVLALGEYTDDLVDDDNFVRYLPILRESGRAVCVEQGAPLLSELGEATLPFQPIGDAQLAALAGRHTSVLRF